MLTTTTPWAASASAGYCAVFPCTSAPPWIQTITGRGAFDVVAGRQTFSVRQSSDLARSSACMQAGPNARASSIAAQGFTGCGTRQRNFPTGGAA